MATRKKSETSAAGSRARRDSKPAQDSKGMDGLSLLEHDHRAVEKLFKQFDKAKEGDEQRRLAEQVCRELTVHARIEEEVLYPEARTMQGLEDMVLESLEEHRQVKELVAEIQGMSPGDEAFEPRMKVLREDVEHHVQEEEKELFPKFQKMLGKDRLLDLGQALQQHKAEAGAPGSSQEVRRTREGVRAPDERGALA